MSYVSGSERKFRGMSGFDSFRGSRSAFGAVDLSTFSNLNPQDVASRAAAGASKYADKVQQDAYKYFYAQAAKAWTAIDTDPTVNKIRQAGNALAETGISAKALVDRFSKGGDVDASGIADAAQLAQNGINSVLAFAQMVGMNSSAASKVTKWSSIATGCAAGIATGTAAGPAGAAAGAVACAFSLILGFFGERTQKQPPVYAPLDAKLAVFIPNTEQTPFVIVDAARLAAVLKRFYGVTSYASIASKLSHHMLGTYYDARPARQADGTFASPEEAPPAFTLFDVLEAVAFEHGNATVSSIQEGLRVGYYLRKTIEDKAIGGDYAYSVRNAETRLKTDREVNVGIVAETAKANRFEINNGRSPGMVNINSFIPGQNNPLPFDLRPFTRTNELLEFFAAVTMKEQADGQKPFEAFTETSLPIRHYWVDDFDRRAVKQAAYGKRCWTNWERYVDACPDLSGKRDIAAAMQVAQVRLQAAFSYLHMTYRWSGVDLIAKADVTSTFSVPPDPRHAVPMSKSVPLVWTSSGSYRAGDTEKWQLTTLPSDQGATLFKRIKAWEAYVSPVAAAARKAAAGGSIATVSSNILQQFAAGTKTAVIGAGSDAVQQMIKSGALKLETIYAGRKKCRDAGGAWSEAGMACATNSAGVLNNCTSLPASDNSTKRYYCVPKGTPGSTPITDSMLASLPGGGGGSSILPLIAIAGAGFLLMQLLKKK